MLKRQPITILIADDDPDDQELTREAFEANLLLNPVQFVSDGDAVLEYVRQEGRFEGAALPGIILLDLNMPMRGGHDTLAALKADPRFRKIPVIVLTTSKADADIARSYTGGASSFITKPVTFDALVAVVATFGKYWLELVELPPEGT